MAMATRNGTLGNVALNPADGDLATRVEQHRDVGPDAEERGLRQGDLPGEAVDQVRPDAHDPEHGEQAQVEQRRGRAADGKDHQKGEASGQRRPLDDRSGPRPGRPVQVETEQGDDGQPPHPQHASELRVAPRGAARRRPW